MQCFSMITYYFPGVPELCFAGADVPQEFYKCLIFVKTRPGFTGSNPGKSGE